MKTYYPTRGTGVALTEDLEDKGNSPLMAFLKVRAMPLLVVYSYLIYAFIYVVGSPGFQPHLTNGILRRRLYSAVLLGIGLLCSGVLADTLWVKIIRNPANPRHGYMVSHFTDERSLRSRAVLWFLVGTLVTVVGSGLLVF